MASSDLLVQLSKYESFKYNVSKMLVEVDKGINALETPKDKIEVYYTIDDTRADNNKLTDIYNRLITQRKFLNDVCLPDIEEKIRSIKRAIEEEEERRKRLLSRSTKVHYKN